MLAGGLWPPTPQERHGASRKLDQLDAATGLRGLARPGNRLERLKGDRKGQWSIRIND